MKTLISLLLLLTTTIGYSTQYHSSGSGNWSSAWNTGLFQNGDSIYVDAPHNVTVNGTINHSSLDVTIFINGTLSLGNPGFLRLGSESIIYVNGSISVDGLNNNDHIEIGTREFTEDDLSTLPPGAILTKDGELPVELISFTAKINDHVVLNWSTASQLNNDHFTIARSFDGRNFNDIVTIPGEQYSYDLMEYEYVDHDVPSGIIYYRLSQTDYDGSVAHFNIVRVNHDSKIIHGIRINNDEEILSMLYINLNGQIVSDRDHGIKVLVIVTETNKYYKKIIN